MDLWLLLGDIIVLLAASLLLGGLFSRFGQSPLVGYLLAGMFLGGPGSIRAVRSEQEIEAIAELGVALLLFSLGLEFSLARLRSLGRTALLGGVVQVVATIVVGLVGALAFGAAFREATAFGAMIALSSTAIVLRMLLERGELETPHGRHSLAVLLTQDIAVVPLALLMTILGGEGTVGEVSWQVAKLLVMAAGLVVGLLLANQIAVLALGTLTLSRNRELTVIFAIVAGLGAAWLAHFAGISPALGAFVAGMLLGSSAFATQIRADVSPLRVLLLTLFFGAAGMVADPLWIVTHWYLVGAVTVLITVGKLLVIWVIFAFLGQSTRVAAATGLCLAQIGEFAFVLGNVGRASGVVSEEMYALVVSTTIVSFFLSAFLVPWAPAFGDLVARLSRAEQVRAEIPEVSPDPPQVAIIGYGPAGQIAARPLLDAGRRVIVIDLNQQGTQRAIQQGFEAELGDATQNEILEHAHLAECQAVVITVPHHQSALTILENVRKHAPHTHVIVRSRYQLYSGEYVAEGANEVAGDEEEVGEKMSQLLGEWLRNNPARS